MISKNIDKMIQLSKAKKEDLSEILELTKKQKIYIENDKMDSLDDTISAKDNLMNKIDLLDLEFLSLYGEIKKMENVESLDEINFEKYKNITRLQENIREINRILKNIASIDKENTRIIKEEFSEVKSGLRQVKEVRKAYKGYNYSPGGSVLLDEKK